MVWGSNSGGGKIFHTCPDHPRNAPVLCSECRLFMGSKEPKAWVWLPTPFWPQCHKVELHLYHPCVFVVCYRVKFAFTLCHDSWKWLIKNISWSRQRSICHPICWDDRKKSHWWCNWLHLTFPTVCFPFHPSLTKSTYCWAAVSHSFVSTVSLHNSRVSVVWTQWGGGGISYVFFYVLSICTAVLQLDWGN
jgi:hypothetical protein